MVATRKEIADRMESLVPETIKPSFPFRGMIGYESLIQWIKNVSNEV